MTQDRTENSRAPPMRHHGFKMARRVSDTYKMCECFILSCSKNVLNYRNIHFSKIYPRILKLQQKLRYSGFSLVHTVTCMFIVFENFQIRFILNAKIKIFYINVKVT